MKRLVSNLALAAVGFGIGLLAEEKLVGSLYRIDPEAVKLLSSIHTQPYRITMNDGASLYAEIDDESEIDDGLTVIFCHGYGLDLDCWHYQRLALESRARLVFYDQRSHGGSEQTPRASNTIDQLGEDLATVIDKVGGEGPIVLVGHSMGGMTIMSLAASHPELFTSGRIAGVALLATTDAGLSEGTFGLPPTIAKSVHRHADATMERALQQATTINRVRTRSSDLSLWLVNRYSFGTPEITEHTAFTAQMLNSASMDTVADFLLTLEAHDKSAALATFANTPVSLVMGSSDLLTPPNLYAEQMTRMMPHAKYTLLPSTGHMLMLERADTVTGILVELLDTVRGINPETHGFPEDSGAPQAQESAEVAEASQDLEAAQDLEASQDPEAAQDLEASQDSEVSGDLEVSQDPETLPVQEAPVAADSQESPQSPDGAKSSETTATQDSLTSGGPNDA